ncbi:preprotein translocase subunit SecG [Patescibacteria group bacterium]
MSLLPIISMVLAAILTVLVLIQNRGAGLSGVFGGDSAVFSQKRGSEKTLHIVTIIVAVAFLASALMNLVFS